MESSGNRFAVAVNEPPTVTFLLDGGPKRQSLLQQVLWMRLEGLSISRIARVVNKDTETIQSVIDLWQFQVERVTGPFTPLAVCPRREAGRRRKKLVSASKVS